MKPQAEHCVKQLCYKRVYQGQPGGGDVCDRHVLCGATGVRPIVGAAGGVPQGTVHETCHFETMHSAPDARLIFLQCESFGGVVPSPGARSI
ncbi:hypothetical protein NQZ68_007725 [Dissostichus eleginoides]|nr:hypothetical protein NQZ68_007725 [Dissostichus eleginoides]